jgi:hypothetical protein
MEQNKLTSDNGKSGEKKKSTGRFRAILVLLILLLLLLLIYTAVRPPPGQPDGGAADAGTISVDTIPVDTVSADTAAADTIDTDTAFVDPDSLKSRLDSLSRARALADSITRARADSLARIESRRAADSLARLEDSLSRARLLADSLARADTLRIADSLARLEDSLSRARSLADSLARADSLRIADSLARVVDPCLRDTLAPWVTPDPSGGLHRRAVNVRLIPNKPNCIIEWSIDGTDNWKRYDGQPIPVSGNSTLYYRAVDECGRRMDTRSKRYVFDMADVSARCPADMEFVKVGGREFCIDVYEWPNRRGVMPQSFVSLFQAMDSCFSVRKRLCTSDEWTTACAGPDNWTYLYGPSYDANVCVARDTMAQRSGSRPECRGYFGVFDMSGNLAEWTSTQAPQARTFNNVMGGFWTSGSQSRCTDARYSYFPQNRHNPVGFRCCRDANPPQTRSGR